MTPYGASVRHRRFTMFIGLNKRVLCLFIDMSLSKTMSIYCMCASLCACVCVCVFVSLWLLLSQPEGLPPPVVELAYTNVFAECALDMG